MHHLAKGCSYISKISERRYIDTSPFCVSIHAKVLHLWWYK